MIAFENVSKSFWTGKSRKVILDRASFRVELGNSLGILARNGSGKTTIINMMAGLEKPDEGRITRAARISFPLGFMGGVINKHTATENARYIARLYGLDADYIESFCRWLTDIGEYFDMPVGTYSSGMRARLGFAVALAMEADLLLIDEVLSVGDQDFQEKSEKAVMHAVNQGCAMVLVSHSPIKLKKWTDSVLTFEKGIICPPAPEKVGTSA